MRSFTVLLAALTLSACASTKQAAAPSSPPAAAARETPMSVGERVPAIMLRTVNNQPVSLASMYDNRPLIITFYRGGWCPYCNKALEQWDSRLSEINAAGADFIAITPERPDLAAATASKDHLEYPVYSDADSSAARALGIAFTLNEATQAKYEGYGIDLPKVNDSTRWELPHPATFIIDTTGTIRYAHVDPDYAKGRANPDEVLAALRTMK